MHKEEYINNFRLNPRADRNSALKADGGSCWLKLNSKLKLNSVLFPYKTFTGSVFLLQMSVKLVSVTLVK